MQARKNATKYSSLAFIAPEKIEFVLTAQSVDKRMCLEALARWLPSPKFMRTEFECHKSKRGWQYWDELKPIKILLFIWISCWVGFLWVTLTRTRVIILCCRFFTSNDNRKVWRISKQQLYLNLYWLIDLQVSCEMWQKSMMNYAAASAKLDGKTLCFQSDVPFSA